MFSRQAMIVVACGAIAVTVAMGVRQAHGIFQYPITTDLGVGREVFGLAMALGFLVFGLVQPFVGLFSDKYGARVTMLIGGVVYVASLALTQMSTSPFELYLTMGLLGGLSMSSTTYIVVLAAIARVVPPERRSVAMGIATAAGSFGMFAMIPIAQGALGAWGWQNAFLLLAAISILLPLMGFGMPGRPEAPPPGMAAEQSIGGAINEASGHSGYWLLVAGFFVCGFHVAFIGTHLPAFLTDQNVSAETAANALALIGLFNIAGSFFFGSMGDKYRKKYILAWIYLARSAVIAVFMIVPFSDVSALVFGAAIGFLWLGTVPLTNGLVAQIFGLKYLSMLAGVVFMSHQIGSFLGAWLGGYAYDATGSYNMVWIAAIVLGLVAFVLHLPIADAPVERLKQEAAKEA